MIPVSGPAPPAPSGGPNALRHVGSRLHAVLLGAWGAPPLRWAPGPELGLAMGAIAAILAVNAVKILCPRQRELVDWGLLNFGIFWLLPLVWWTWRRPDALVGSRVGWARLLVGLLLVAQVPLGGESQLMPTRIPVEALLGYGYFQIGVQVSEVFFFFGFFHPRAVKALGTMGAIPVTVLALTAMQASSTDPLSWQVWADCLSRATLEVALFALVPSLPVIGLFEVLAGALGETRELQLGLYSPIVPVENALWAATAFLGYGLTLIPVAILRRRRALLAAGCLFILLSVGGFWVFKPARDRLLPPAAGLRAPGEPAPAGPEAWDPPR